jgi:hypothetical protein
MKELSCHQGNRTTKTSHSQTLTQTVGKTLKTSHRISVDKKTLTQGNLRKAKSSREEITVWTEQTSHSRKRGCTHSHPTAANGELHQHSLHTAKGRAALTVTPHSRWRGPHQQSAHTADGGGRTNSQPNSRGERGCIYQPHIAEERPHYISTLQQ